MLSWIKKSLKCFKSQRNGTENRSSNNKDTSKEKFQLQMTVLHQSMCIKVDPSSLRHVLAEYKDKERDVSDSHQNIRKLCNSKLKSPKV